MHEKMARSKKQSNKRGEKEHCRKNTRVKTARVWMVGVVAREKVIRSIVKKINGAMILNKKVIHFIIENNDLRPVGRVLVS